MALNIPGLLGGIGSGVQSGFQNMNQGVNNYFSGQGGPAGYDPQDVATARNQSLAQMAALFLAGAQPMSGAQRAQYIAQVPMVGDDYRKNLRGMRDDRREEGAYQQMLAFGQKLTNDPAALGLNADQATLLRTLDPQTAYKLYAEQRAESVFGKTDNPASVQEYQFALKGGYEGSYTDFLQAKKAGTNVNVTLPGEPGADADLRKKLNEGEGTAWSDTLKAGNTAAGMMGDLQMIEALIPMLPTNAWSGRAAEMFPGISRPADAFTAIIKRVAPSLRQEGSGSTSDIEYQGFVQSLPALNTMPETRMAVAATLKAKAQISIERADIVRQYQNGELTDIEARKALGDVDKRSILSPQLKQIIEGLVGGGAALGESTLTDDDLRYLQPAGQ